MIKSIGTMVLLIIIVLAPSLMAAEREQEARKTAPPRRLRAAKKNEEFVEISAERNVPLEIAISTGKVERVLKMLDENPEEEKNLNQLIKLSRQHNQLQVTKAFFDRKAKKPQ